MTSLNLDNRRPCSVAGQKAMFHCWSHESWPVGPSLLVGGHSGGIVAKTLGIVEFENGTINKVEPESIIFVDGGAFDEVSFGEVDDRQNNNR